MSGAEAGTLETGLARALARVGLGPPAGMTRLTGGATMESWRFEASGEHFVLRRAPSAAMMEGRAIGHDIEAAAIRAVHAVGVLAPEIVVELEPDDGLGTGFVMRALPGTPDPRTILADNAGDAEGQKLAGQLARELAGIHGVDFNALPEGLPTLDPAEGVAGLRTQFEEAGGDRPVVALALRWLEDNLPAPTDPALIHGDYRLGNVLVAGRELTGVLDWELAHLGDPHEDLAYACMTVWRFARIDRPAAGLASLDDLFAAYEAAGGRPVDPACFHWWLVYRTCWWALGCWRMGRTWREGADRTVERAIISRRTSEQELDLLLLLESEAPQAERERVLPPSSPLPPPTGEATAGELATAISEWLATVKDRMEGHDRFQHAVARNALGIIARDYAAKVDPVDAPLARALLDGSRRLAEPGLLAQLRRTALDKLAVDMPKYPALAVARRQWTGED
ncbi:phosphotransferase [Altererythrobacter litoralis]|uniref:Phosphotransferase n=1 Tax=Altererythrobacter litoralis TaxID=3113904 RepID=A0ABU7GDC1_9SPHN|nr:phosphotransferase [Erythrobacteraceae bacterium 1XM1-14]